MVLHFRLVDATSVAVLQEMMVTTYREYFGGYWTKKGLESVIKKDFAIEVLLCEIEQQTNYYLALQSSGKPVGFLKIKHGSLLPGTDSFGSEIGKLYFRKEETGTGYGVQAMDFACELAQKNGEEVIWLDVLKANTGAIRFYQRYGFSTVGEQPFKTDSQDIGLWIMCRSCAVTETNSDN